MNKAYILVLLASTVVFSACSRSSEPTPTPTATPSPVTQPPATPTMEEGVVLEIPDENLAVSSPMNIEGLAPGTWFFEGQLRGEVVSQGGESLATFPLMAMTDWMTEEHVRFEGKAEFEAPEGDEVIRLIIRNDNPSGLPENDKSQEFTLLLEQ